MDSPLVSICCITYNHVNFIGECIEGFLKQRTSFNYEIIIHDDASTDGTRELLNEYQLKHPDKFKLILQDENQWSKGVRGIFARFTFPLAKGKYIAPCEGDDYWTDPLKLQKQVDFLEANHGFTASMHRLKFQIQNSTEDKELHNGSNEERTCGAEDVINFSLDGTASLVCRRECVIPYPKEFLQFMNGDTLLFLMLATKGKIHYIPDSMGVYRKHEGGLTNNSSFSGYNYFKETRRFLTFADAYSEFKYSKTIMESKLRLMRWTAEPDSISKFKRFQLSVLKVYYNLCISALFRFNLNVNKLLNL